MVMETASFPPSFNAPAVYSMLISGGGIIRDEGLGAFPKGILNLFDHMILRLSLCILRIDLRGHIRGVREESCQIGGRKILLLCLVKGQDGGCQLVIKAGGGILGDPHQLAA